MPQIIIPSRVNPIIANQRKAKKLADALSNKSTAKGLKMKLSLSLLVLAIAGIGAPATAVGQQGEKLWKSYESRPDPRAPSTTYNLDAHFNHFHVYVKPPEFVPINPQQNLLADQAGLEPIMLAAAPSPTATDAGAASGTVAAKGTATKYDAVFSMCGPMHSADQVPSNIERDNLTSPIPAVSPYFETRGILLNLITGHGKPEPVQLKVLKDPEHGKLVPYSEAGLSFIYLADQGYLGVDQIVYEVEVLGKSFKVIETVVVHNSGNIDYPTDAAKEIFRKACPGNNRSSLDIIGATCRVRSCLLLHSTLHKHISFPSQRFALWRDHLELNCPAGSTT